MYLLGALTIREDVDVDDEDDVKKLFNLEKSMKKLTLRPLYCAIALVVVYALPALAAGEGVVVEATGGQFLSTKAIAALAMTMATIGGAWSQAKVVTSALESIGRNPGAAGSMNQPWFLALVFIESLVLFTMVVVMKLIGIF